ncbi:amidohydrolase family protein [Nocardioides sp. cx-173]|uniref:amidohydrolase family protein n=1 Tax=Nocardioides sp. cx-173 TaxID=2898796 RepID=UPI001E301C4F|nr:amidohydrolase family protein [Nocardioides sp. cx-173]MCD4524212.1 amidohydrolase [Nocardioides sp. cx-173]UGB41604.1 amidohydrolase [Nocardioides sp. cx-173]
MTDNKDAGERLVVISSDCHAGASLYGYKEYLPKHWQVDFDAWAATFGDPWVEHEERDISYGVAAMESQIGCDSAYRQKIIEGDGIVGEVIFPNSAPPYFPSGVLSVSVPHTMPEYERRMAGLRAHNTWLAEFCNDVPGRRIGVAQIFLNNIDDTLDEVKRIVELGLNSILLPSETPGGLVPLYPPRLEPLWELCADLGVVVHKHGNFAGDPNTPEFGDAAGIIGSIEGMTWNRRGLAHMVMSGVFERHPNLKMAYTETGADWVPAYVAGMDGHYRAALVPNSPAEFFGGPAVRNLPKLPSEYFKTNVWIGASFMTPSEGAHRYDIGVDRIMWGSDLPHSEGTYPHTLKALRAVFGGLPLEETKAMIAGNASELYGFDLDLLQKAADVVGPLASEVATPLADDEWPRVPEESTCPTFFNQPVRA